MGDYPGVYPSDTLPPMKDVGLRIRIQRELRDRFMEACREQDKPAAQVIREFMRNYIAEHSAGEPSRFASRKEDAQ